MTDDIHKLNVIANAKKNNDPVQHDIMEKTYTMQDDIRSITFPYTAHLCHHVT